MTEEGGLEAYEDAIFKVASVRCPGGVTRVDYVVCELEVAFFTDMYVSVLAAPTTAVPATSSSSTAV